MLVELNYRFLEYYLWLTVADILRTPVAEHEFEFFFGEIDRKGFKERKVEILVFCERYEYNRIPTSIHNKQNFTKKK